MSRPLSLIWEEVLNKDAAREQKTNSIAVQVEKCTQNCAILGEVQQVKGDETLYRERVLDSISNREQREKFTKQIIIIMCSEIAFIALLILGVFLTSYLNAFAPSISFNFPPIFITVSIVFSYFYLYKYTEVLPNIRIACKQIKFRKHEFSTQHGARVLLTIALLASLNIFARQHHVITFDKIILSDSIVNIILYTALAVFIKTTILARYIIKGLYDALNKNEKGINI